MAEIEVVDGQRRRKKRKPKPVVKRQVDHVVALVVTYQNYVKMHRVKGFEAFKSLGKSPLSDADKFIDAM